MIPNASSTTSTSILDTVVARTRHIRSSLRIGSGVHGYLTRFFRGCDIGQQSCAITRSFYWPTTTCSLLRSKRASIHFLLHNNYDTLHLLHLRRRLLIRLQPPPPAVPYLTHFVISFGAAGRLVLLLWTYHWRFLTLRGDAIHLTADLTSYVG